jgi:hypothetical protein
MMGDDLKSRPLRHIGIMVEDVNLYAKLLSTVLPELEKWKFVTCKMEKDVILVGEPATFYIGLATAGNITYELVQVTDNPNAYQAKARKGFHHVSYEYTGDIEDEKRRLLANGFEIKFAAHLHDGEKCYFFEPVGVEGTVAIELNNFCEGYPLQR